MASSNSGESLVDRLPLKTGAVAGVAAFVVGYVLTFVLATIDSEFEDGGWEDVGNVYYNAHFVDTEITAEVMGETSTETENLLREASTQIPEVVYFLVPVVVLVGAGFFAVQNGPAVTDVQDAALGGATIAAGVLPLALVGTFLFEMSTEIFGTEVSASPELVMGVLLVGIVYPVVFGAVGGALSEQFD